MTDPENREARLLYLCQKDVVDCAPPMSHLIDLIESAFREKGLGHAQMPPKSGLHPREDCFMHAMPAFLPGMRAAGIKWIAGYPVNHDRGLPYINGLLILSDPETGLPEAVMDAAWITAERTGAATAVAARHLARPDASVLSILGCGVQGRSNLRALRCVLPRLRKVRSYDIHRDRTERYNAEMSRAYPDVEFLAAGSPREAVEGADVIITAGPIRSQPRPVIESAWVKTGSFVCPLDYGSYVTPDMMRKADKFLADDAAQILDPGSSCFFPELPPLYGDLGEVVAGLKAGREKATERIVCANLGLAIDDVAMGREVFKRARAEGRGVPLPL